MSPSALDRWPESHSRVQRERRERERADSITLNWVEWDGGTSWRVGREREERVRPHDETKACRILNAHPCRSDGWREVLRAIIWYIWIYVNKTDGRNQFWSWHVISRPDIFNKFLLSFSFLLWAGTILRPIASVWVCVCVWIPDRPHIGLSLFCTVAPIWNLKLNSARRDRIKQKNVCTCVCKLGGFVKVR